MSFSVLWKADGITDNDTHYWLHQLSFITNPPDPVVVVKEKKRKQNRKSNFLVWPWLRGKMIPRQVLGRVLVPVLSTIMTSWTSYYQYTTTMPCHSLKHTREIIMTNSRFYEEGRVKRATFSPSLKSKASHSTSSA